MTDARTYPHGVPCWVDTEQPDPGAALRFYGELFGWTFQDAVPAEAPGSYWIASLDGRDAVAIAPGSSGPVAWNTYVAVGRRRIRVLGRGQRRSGRGRARGRPWPIRTRQADVAAPPGFEDAIAWLVPLEAGAPASHWHVTFAVGDRDESVAAAERLGAAVVSSDDSDWTRSAVIRDPQGAELTLSQFTPPTG